MDRLTARDEQGAYLLLYGEYANLVDAAIDRLAAYEDAEEQGRLVVLPSDPYEMADVAQEILSRACRLQRAAEAALGGGGDAVP